MVFEVYAKVLPRGISEDAARRFFSRFGEVVAVAIRLSKDKNRTFGFISFADMASCQRCIDSCPLMLDNVRIHVQMSSKCNASVGATETVTTNRAVRTWSDGEDETTTVKTSFSPVGRSAVKSPASGSKLTSGSLVCVVQLDKQEGVAYVQDAMQRRKLADLMADIRDYNELNSLEPQSMKSGQSILISVKSNLYRGTLLDDLNIDRRNSIQDVHVYFIDIGRKAFVQPGLVLPMPERFSHMEPLCSPISFSGISTATLCEIFKNHDYCVELFGQSLNVTQCDPAMVKWFIVEVERYTNGIPSVKLSGRDCGRCLNTILRQYQQNDLRELEEHMVLRKNETTEETDDYNSLKQNDSCNSTDIPRTNRKRDDFNNSTNKYESKNQFRESADSGYKPVRKNDMRTPERNDYGGIPSQRTKFMVESMPKQAIQQGGKYVITHCDSLESVFLCPSEVLTKAMDACVSYSENLANIKRDDATPCKGELVMALYPADSVWYRGEVKSISRDAVTVFFVDFGNTEELSKSECNVLSNETKEIAQIPIGIVECALRVPNKKQLSDSSAEKFLEVALHRTFNCKFDFSDNIKPELVEAVTSEGKSLLDMLWNQDKPKENITNGHASMSSHSDKCFDNSKESTHVGNSDRKTVDIDCNEKISLILSTVREGIEYKRKFVKMVEDQIMAEESLLRRLEEALK